MPSLDRIQGGIALSVLILGSTTVLFSQNAPHQEANADHPVAPVQGGAGSARSDADSAQERRLTSPTRPDNSAASLAVSQNATAPSAGQQPTGPTGPLWPQLPTPTEGEQAQGLQRAVGTAGAPAPAVLPIAAAEPTGIAIAPAKQRRVRKIVLKVGALVGASAALSTVLILTETTPSKPAVAH
jgi:hypothetical protein